MTVSVEIGRDNISISYEIPNTYLSFLVLTLTSICGSRCELSVVSPSRLLLTVEINFFPTNSYSYSFPTKYTDAYVNYKLVGLLTQTYY